MSSRLVLFCCDFIYNDIPAYLRWQIHIHIDRCHIAPNNTIDTVPWKQCIKLEKLKMEWILRFSDIHLQDTVELKENKNRIQIKSKWILININATSIRFSGINSMSSLSCITVLDAHRDLKMFFPPFNLCCVYHNITKFSHRAEMRSQETVLSRL